MTRLTTDDIKTISEDLEAYDEQLVVKTGCTLSGIASQAAGVRESEINKIAADILVGVIPITFSQGIIRGFCEAVADIVSHFGCRAFVTKSADVAGFAEAFEKKSDVLTFADDSRFITVDLSSGHVADNSEATAKGFVAGLSKMAGGLNEKNVLVIGCGPVGRYATQALIGGGARVSVFDINPANARNLADATQRSTNSEVRISKNLDTALNDHKLIVDATPAGNIIYARHIHSDTYISAPGVPLGLSEKARSKISNRLLHDPLQIGVATMIACALKSRI